jgi:tRNA-2-methylthio-N6-dimethylallyladenosine synthase
MNRKHDRAHYLDVIARIRAARPEMAFSTDFIVGFPGEREEDFLATLSLIDEVGFASAYSFSYSPRPGTPAADMPDQLPDEIKSERLQRLQRAIERQQAAFMARCLGRTFEVLFEKSGRHPGQVVGRSPYLQPVLVMASSSLFGEIRAVTMTEIRTNSLCGTLVAPQAGAVPDDRVLVQARG